MRNYIEKDLLELLRENEEIIIHLSGVYDHSLSGYHEDRFITLLSSEKELLPYSVVMESSFDFHDYRNQKTICLTREQKDGAVIIREPVSRSLKLTETGLSEKEIRFMYLKTFLSNCSSHGYELLPIREEILKMSTHARVGEAQKGMRDVIEDRIEDLLLSLLKNEEISAGNIIGYGKGLTPSADDFCLGLLSVLEVSGEKQRMERLKKYITLHQKKTTEVSFWMLEYALKESKYPQIILEYYNGNPEDASLLEIFLKHGSTSGVDMLTGILCGLSILNKVQEEF